MGDGLPGPVRVCGFGLAAAGAGAAHAIATHAAAAEAGVVLVGAAGTYDPDRLAIGAAYDATAVRVAGIGAGGAGPAQLGFADTDVIALAGADGEVLSVAEAADAGAPSAAVLRLAHTFDDVLLDMVDHPEQPCLSQLIEAQARFGGSVLAVMRVPREQVSRYGIVTIEPGGPVAPGLYRMRDVVEKPHPDEAPSDLAVIGRYALSPNIFHMLEMTPAGAGGEIQLTDAIRLLLRQEPVYALEFAGVRYDTGDPVGLLTTSLAYALKRPDLAPAIKAYLRTLRLD